MAYALAETECRESLVLSDFELYGGRRSNYFGRFVREVLLGDPIDPQRQKPAFPKIVCYQRGRLIARRLDNVPEGLSESLRLRLDEMLELPGEER
jgi:hypothetical protein